MTPNEAYEQFEEPFVIHYTDDIRSDGGHHTPHGPTPVILETRERLATVESQMQTNGDTLERIEGSVEDVKEHIEEVDDQSLDKERFDEDFKDDIERNAGVVNLLIWIGGVLLGLLGLLSTLMSLGYLP